MKISSNKKKVLIVSDIHHTTSKLHKIINHEAPDVVLCLGDWFDSHTYDSIFDCEKTARYLMKYVYQPNAYTLWGNHDLHYFFTNRRVMCSGFSNAKDICITDALHPNFNAVKDKFLWYAWVDDYLCTHAGLHPYYLNPKMVVNQEEVDIFLKREEEICKMAIINDDKHWMYNVGNSRGGYSKYGGITWCDFEDEFEPIEGLKQIVGHTYSPRNEVRGHYKEKPDNPLACNNICIDCNLNEYIIVSNGKLEIKQFIDIQ